MNDRGLSRRLTPREALNMALHFGVAAALAALVLYHHRFIVLATFIYAWLREQGQHRWIIEITPAGTANGEPLYLVNKSTFFGWMTWHRMWEVIDWTVGAAVVVAAYELFFL